MQQKAEGPEEPAKAKSDETRGRSKNGGGQPEGEADR